MADEKRRLTISDIIEKHGMHVDPTDTHGRRRIARAVDILYSQGVRAEEPGLTPVERGSCLKALTEYKDMVAGKPRTPVEQTLNIVSKSAEESAAAILEMLGQKKKDAAPTQQPTKPQTIQ